MKKQKIKFVYAAIIAISLAIISGSLYLVYEKLGGFESVEIFELAPLKRTVVGRHFKTRYSNKVLEEHFIRSKELILADKIDGDLMVVNYLSDSLADNEVDQFIGIALKEDMAEIPVDFDIVEFQSKNRYVTFLSMHPLVRPASKEIEALIFAKAQEEGKELEDFFFELHYEDNSMSIEGWIK